MLKRKGKIAALILVIWFLAHTVLITVDGMSDELAKVDVGVVLGNKVEMNGEPSARLKGRLDKAIQLYKKGYFQHIIVSGGVGVEGFDEAQVMKKYLIEHGIEEEKIIADSNGINTRMTAKNTKEMMDQMDWESAMVITQIYHISRTKLAFWKVGISNTASAHADFFEMRDIFSLFREFFAYYRYLW
ncbi:YdcF family protein [Brevibacillus reuszeri]|uniref:YdcF family protein n=1 Tax=Brevibacillus reuszeri TaxID=54915 RepID=UPI00289E8E52|nr:YdcF family protein [Brevibacillus reuszeri]